MGYAEQEAAMPRLVAENEELKRKLNHESYCHDKAAQDRTKAERERDDLASRALIALAGAHVCTPLEGFVKAPHTLPHCIEDLARERDALTAKLAEAEKHQQSPGTRARIERANDRAEKAEAEAAALAHRLTLMGEALVCCRTSGHEVARLALERDEALSKPGPGAALLERVRKLEEVAEVAKRDAGRDGAGVTWEMTEALKALWRISRD